MSLLCFITLAYFYALVQKLGLGVSKKKHCQAFSKFQIRKNRTKGEIGSHSPILFRLSFDQSEDPGQTVCFVCFTSLACFYWPGKKLGLCVISQTFRKIEIQINRGKKGEKIGMALTFEPEELQKSNLYQNDPLIMLVTPEFI